MSTQGFGIEEIAAGFHLDGVLYRGRLESFDFLSASLVSRAFSEHVRLAQNAGVHDYRAASAPQVYSISDALFMNKSGAHKKLVEKARNSLDGCIGVDGELVFVLTQVVYHSRGSNRVIHDVDLKKSWQKKANMDSAGYIVDSKTNAKEQVQTLFNTKDSPKKANAVLKWITGFEVYTFCFDQNSAQARVVSLGVDKDNDRFYLNANDHIGISNSRPALGVRLSQKR
ncbi:MAG: hypothetical protein Q7K43_00660 [Candidatus Woesearchaeota archaeon]|nr:hypothetical protein [Candidatus Woesearchaeota archaeon]